MRHALVVSLLSFGLALSSQAQVPQMNKVQPDSGKVGSVLRVHGLYLGKEKVEEVYLTDHTFDMMVADGTFKRIFESHIPCKVSNQTLACE